MRLLTAINSIITFINLLTNSSSANNNFRGKEKIPLWSTYNNKIYYKGNTEYRIKGMNIAGFESMSGIPVCLFMKPFDFYLDFLQTNKFNSIRLPFSYETTLNLDNKIPFPSTLAGDPELQNKTMREILHSVIYKCQVRNISVLLDFHTIHGVINPLPYTETVTKPMVLEGWNRMMEFTKYNNVIGLDAKNEPHDISMEIWLDFVNDFINNINKNYTDFNGLFFIEGLNDNHGSPWGSSFENFNKSLLKDITKIVFSPHIYGVSVRGSIAIHEGEPEFKKWFGFLKDIYTNAIVIGEFGGFYMDLDREWHERVAHYLRKLNITSNFYWELLPSSSDTGGIFDSNCISVNYDKMNYLNNLQPNPTIVDFF